MIHTIVGKGAGRGPRGGIVPVRRVGHGEDPNPLVTDRQVAEPPVVVLLVVPGERTGVSDY